MFREPTMRCPSCGDSILRPFVGRLVCDRCQGFFLSEADLVRAIVELTALAVEVGRVDEATGHRACPRCGAAMAVCHLRVSLPGIHVRTGTAVDCCPADGVWLAAKELEEIFARVERELTHRSSR